MKVCAAHGSQALRAPGRPRRAPRVVTTGLPRRRRGRRAGQRLLQQLPQALGEPRPRGGVRRIARLILELRRIEMQVVELSLTGLVLDVAEPVADVAHAEGVGAGPDALHHAGLIALDDDEDA